MFKKAVIVLMVVGLLAPLVAKAHEPAWWADSEFRPVVDALRVRGFDADEVERTFASSRVAWYPNLPQLQPRESSGEDPYAKFLTPESVDRGRDFLRTRKEVLDRVERDYGVPREALAAILRIESDFGTNTGDFQAFGVFASLVHWSHSQKWQEFGKKELIALFEVAEITNTHPLDIKGSWAGAFGLPQFLPTSFLAFRVDGDHDGAVDLYGFEDALASKANYLISDHYIDFDGDGRAERVNWNTSPRRAVYAYNHSWGYVNFVFDYAEALGWEE